MNRHVRFNLDSWPTPPPLFGWLQGLGGLSDQEMFETFNAGIGFVIVVARSQAGPIRRRLARVGARDCVVIGHVEKGHGVVVPSRDLRYEGYCVSRTPRGPVPPQTIRDAAC